jgi:D-alanyl-D-alanine-carboxypeptidase/D-alanyl-D-alanine-endopeptidase
MTIIHTIIKKTGGLVCVGVLAKALFFSAEAAVPSDADIPTMLKERIDRDEMGIGIVVGLVDTNGSRVFSYGKMKVGENRQVDGDTLFELASITKVFTALVFQDMADHQELQLNDPVKQFLPSTVKMPSYKGREITLVDLATHTSGLPSIGFGVWHILMHLHDPYAGFGEKELYKFLSHYKLTNEIGTKVEYSNLGMELLGQALSLRAGTNYEALLLSRICKPLQMNSTCVNLTTELRPRFATGHSYWGKPVADWSCPLPGDGGLRSSANDMLKFLSAEIGLTTSSLSEAMAKTQVPRHLMKGNASVGLGWVVMVRKDTNANTVWHNGASSGYTSCIAFNKKSHRGVVVLCNSDDDVDDLCQILMGSRKYRKVAKVDFSVYDQYVGKYKMMAKETGSKKLVVTSKEHRLFVQIRGQDTDEFLPESATRFFNNSYDEELLFEKDKGGAVTNVVLSGEGWKRKFAKVK